MKVLIIGDAQRYTALQRKQGLAGQQVQWDSNLDTHTHLDGWDLIIDLDFDEHPRRAALYAKYPAVPVLACMVRTSLAQVMNDHAFTQGFNIIGCNWLPGFTDMPVTEMTVLDDNQQEILAYVMGQLGWEYELVADAVGMVTPRVVCMIINEAYMTAEMDTASRADIDTAMRLGTNYPFGPFEWCEKIGVQQVHAVLSAVHAASGNKRYRISTLLEKEALQA